MGWQNPKVNWQGKTDSDGNYTGDRFNAVDFNRIKNNLDYLRALAIKTHSEFTVTALGKDRVPSDYFYADDINKMEGNLTKINNSTLKRDYGLPPSYIDNGNTMSFSDLNRLEGAILDLYDKLSNQKEGRRMFAWDFGMKGGGL